VARLGVLGGTFDPPHVGHLIAARDVLDALGLDRLLLVPVGEPPHKPGGAVAPAEVRARMLEAAVAGDPRLGVSRVEVDRGGPSYTVETLRELRDAHPQDELHLVIGVDQLEVFDTWRAPEEVARLAKLVVMSREGRDPRQVAPGVRVPHQLVPVTRVDLSSSELRDRIARGRSIRHRVPDAVLRIIEEEHLYETGAPLPGAGVGAAGR